MSDLADGRLDLLDGPCSDLGSVLRLGSEHSESIASTGVMFFYVKLKKRNMLGIETICLGKGMLLGNQLMNK